MDDLQKTINAQNVIIQGMRKRITALETEAEYMEAVLERARGEIDRLRELLK